MAQPDSEVARRSRIEQRTVAPGGSSSAARKLLHLLSTARGLRLYLTALIAGAASALAMAPTHLSPVLLATLPLLLALIRSDAFLPARDQLTIEPHPLAHRLPRGFAAGWWFGFGYHLAGLYWIGGAFLVQADSYAWLMPFAVTLMPAGLALFFAAAGLAVASIPARRLDPAIGFILAISAAEAAKGFGFTGFPWNSLGYALAAPMVLMQSAAIFGIYGLTLIAAAIAVLPAVLYMRLSVSGSRRPAMIAAGSAAVPVAMLAAYGSLVLSGPDIEDLPTTQVRIVQPSVPQADKWDPARQQAIFQEHLDLSREAPDGSPDDLMGITHVIWPEAAMPFGPLGTPAALTAIADLLPPGSQLIAGILRLGGNSVSTGSEENPKRQVFNSAAVFDDTGRPIAIYDKVHLVPFGEYLPFPSVLERMGLETVTRQRGGFTAGPLPRPRTSIAGLPSVEMLICYEVVFPQGIGHGEQRPGLLINLTNDGWFGTTSGPYQHLHQARVRAVEFGVPVIRVANNGISAVIDGRGRIRSTLPLDARGTIDTAVPGSLEPTVYSRFREGPFLAMWLALFAAAATARKLVSGLL